MAPSTNSAACSISGSDTVDNSPFFLRFLGDTFSIGLREELVKALPAIALAVSYLYFNSARSDRFGVTEPLDGILICVAAAAAFSLSETFSQYIYQNNDQIAHFFQVNFPKSSIDLSNLTGLVDAKTNDDTGRATLYIGSLYVAANAFEVLIFRMFQDLCGHMAWTGIFGYFIGLFALNPRRNWIALPVGWLIAAALHGFWDSSNSILAMVVCALIGVLGLLAVIIKARQISPNRASNFASTTLSQAGFAQPIPPAPLSAAPIYPVAVQPVAAPPVQAPPVTAAPIPDTGFAGPPVQPPLLAPFKIDIGPLSIPLSVGTILNTDDIPGLEAALAGGKAAIVETNPKDGNMLGLRNLSLQSWEVEYADGRKIRLAPDKAMLIADAAKINFGTAQGEILKVAL
jgi:RsiW-degrading membrane proteinase PrsW (M82 family)